MKSLDEIYKIVEENSHETAFNKGECEALYNLLLKLTPEDNVVEIGTQYGRSTAVIAEVQKEIGFSFITVDNWQESNSQEARDHIHSQADKYDWQVGFIESSSTEAAKQYSSNISLLLIDGDHHYDPIIADCDAWMKKVRSGGYVCFDDYDHEGLPEVKKAVMDWMLRGNHASEFKFVGRYGEKLGVFKRI